MGTLMCILCSGSASKWPIRSCPVYPCISARIAATWAMQILTVNNKLQPSKTSWTLTALTARKSSQEEGPSTMKAGASEAEHRRTNESAQNLT